MLEVEECADVAVAVDDDVDGGKVAMDEDRPRAVARLKWIRRLRASRRASRVAADRGPDAAGRMASERSISISAAAASPWRPPAFEPARACRARRRRRPPRHGGDQPRRPIDRRSAARSGTGIPAPAARSCSPPRVGRQPRVPGANRRPTRSRPSARRNRHVASASPHGMSRDLVDGRAEGSEIAMSSQSASRCPQTALVPSEVAQRERDCARPPSVTKARPSSKSTSSVRASSACCHRSRTECVVASTRRSPSKAGCVFRSRTRSTTRLTTDRSSATWISPDV